MSANPRQEAHAYAERIRDRLAAREGAGLA
jgi:hypothetical protein